MITALYIFHRTHAYFMNIRAGVAVVTRMSWLRLAHQISSSVNTNVVLSTPHTYYKKSNGRGFFQNFPNIWLWKLQMYEYETVLYMQTHNGKIGFFFPPASRKFVGKAFDRINLPAHCLIQTDVSASAEPAQAHTSAWVDDARIIWLSFKFTARRTKWMPHVRHSWNRGDG